MAALFCALASTTNTIANGPNFSHGPLPPLVLFPLYAPSAFRTDERHTVLVSPPQDGMASICWHKTELNVEFSINNYKIDSSVEMRNPWTGKYIVPRIVEMEGLHSSRAQWHGQQWVLSSRRQLQWIHSISVRIARYIFQYKFQRKTDKLQIGSFSYLGKLPQQTVNSLSWEAFDCLSGTGGCFFPFEPFHHRNVAFILTKPPSMLRFPSTPGLHFRPWFAHPPPFLSASGFLPCHACDVMLGLASNT